MEFHKVRICSLKSQLGRIGGVLQASCLFVFFCCMMGSVKVRAQNPVANCDATESDAGSSSQARDPRCDAQTPGATNDVQAADPNCESQSSTTADGKVVLNSGCIDQTSPLGENLQAPAGNCDDQTLSPSGNSQAGSMNRDAHAAPSTGNPHVQDPNCDSETLPQSGDEAVPAARDGKAQMTDKVMGARAKGSKLIPPARKVDDTHPDEPHEIHRQSPYGDLPSLHDLYTQIPSAGAKLKRFGSDAFSRGTGNTNQLPMDMPAGPDYVLGPGDSLVVNLWGGRSARLNLLIDRQGQIALPEAGSIMLNGLTIAQAQSAIQRALSTQFQGEHVELSLGRVRTVRVYVVGDVQRPGGYDVSSLSTPLSALYTAGGPTSRGSLRILRQFRGKQLVREIDLYDFLLRGVRSDSDRLLPGDTLLVPPVGPQVTVEGMVHRPAIYELNGEQGLNQVLDLAGGILVSANLKQINVERVAAHQGRTMLSVQFPDSAEGRTEQLSGFRVQDGDNVVVPKILPYNESAIYLEGHVFRPGKYPFQEGMTINDVLRSYQDVMPEPADHAEIVRLLPPDFRPETISFNVPDVLIGNSPIPLKPFDLIHIFGRYEIDSPKVSIDGEVLRPGRFPMSQGMTVTGLLRMAGGFKRSAFQDVADLSSYEVQDGKRVLINHSRIDLKKALEGDASADAILKPGDVVSIQQLSDWQDIGSSVTITGEVEHAGTYGIEPGERLSAVLKRAGGFREGAYPEGGVLERKQVRELGEKARQEMIRRLETSPVGLKQGLLSGQDQAEVQQATEQQRTQVLMALRSHPAGGRMVIKISGDIGKWEDTPADIELRAGDTLAIPKRPSFVLVSGQVNNATAITYSPGKDAGWYLRQAGGATRLGDKGAIFIVRSDGAVVTAGSRWLGGSIMNLRMKPGDTIMVPERAVGSQTWKNVLAAAQIMSSVAITGAVAGIF